jgi:hypothetical protein
MKKMLKRWVKGSSDGKSDEKKKTGEAGQAYKPSSDSPPLAPETVRIYFTISSHVFSSTSCGESNFFLLAGNFFGRRALSAHPNSLRNHCCWPQCLIYSQT